MNMNEFYEKYPVQTAKLSTNKEFIYRYFHNAEAKHTLVLLTGGIGLSDLFYMHFDRFAKDFSVITFDYQLAFESNKEFAYAHLMKMIESQEKSKKLLKIIPFGIYKKLITRMVMKKVADFTDTEKNLMRGLCDAVLRLLTKEYEAHMIDFLIDARNHFGMTKEDFVLWDNKVLLILSEDDHTFTKPCKDSLIRIMTNPTVVTDILGGHLALLIKLDKYSDMVTSYILER